MLTGWTPDQLDLEYDIIIICICVIAFFGGSLCGAVGDGHEGHFSIGNGENILQEKEEPPTGG